MTDKLVMIHGDLCADVTVLSAEFAPDLVGRALHGPVGRTASSSSRTAVRGPNGSNSTHAGSISTPCRSRYQRATSSRPAGSHTVYP
ncbi:hypothetical protein ACFVXQ_33765, partial [Kitasatospora sp. NPDC058263]